MHGGKRKRPIFDLNPSVYGGLKRTLVDSAAGVAGYIGGNAPGAAAGVALAEILQGGQTLSHGRHKDRMAALLLRKRKRSRKSYLPRKSAKKHKRTRTKTKKAKKAQKKKAKRRLVKLIEHVIDHDVPMGTFRHEGAITAMAPSSGRSFADRDYFGRYFNFGSPQDIQYIASCLFNGNTPVLNGYQGSNPNMFEKTGLKVQVAHHEVHWCIRNSDSIEIEVEHYEFKAKRSGSWVSNVGGTIQYEMKPLDIWSRAYMDLAYTFVSADAGTRKPNSLVPTAVSVPALAPGIVVASEFLRRPNIQPADVIKVMAKYYHVVKKSYRLLPGMCKQLPKTNVFKDVEYDYPGACLDDNQDVCMNINSYKHRLHSSFHVFMHKNEVVTPGNGVTWPTYNGTTSTGAGWYGDGAAPTCRPATATFTRGATANGGAGGGLAIIYKQVCRIRMPANTAIANRKEAFIDVDALSGLPPTGATTQTQVQPMSGAVVVE